MAPRKTTTKVDTAKAAEPVKAESKAAAAQAEAKAPAKAAKTAKTAKTAAKVEEKAPAKAPAKRAAAKKAEPAAEVVIEFGGRQIVAKDVLEAAKKDFAEKHEGTELKSIHLYIKPEESVAYYVVNGGVGDPEDKVEF